MAKKELVEKLLVTRSSIEQKIEGINRTLTCFPVVNRLGIAAKEAAYGVERYMSGRSNGLSENEKRELQTMKDDATNKQNLFLSKKQEEEALRSELASLQTQLSDISRQATATNVLQFQSMIAGMENDLKGLMQTMASEQEKVSQGTAGSQHYADLCREREEIMADLATGVTTDQSLLAEVEAQITTEENRMREVRETGARSAIVVVGIQRRITTAEEAIGLKKAALRTVYCDFLITEAERVGEEFAAAAKALTDKFAQIVAIGTMIKENPEAKGRNVLTGPWLNFKIPKFDLGSCNSSTGNFFWEAGQLNLPQTIQAVKADMAALGIKDPN
jgi:hypothetical protein